MAVLASETPTLDTKLCFVYSSRIQILKDCHNSLCSDAHLECSGRVTFCEMSAELCVYAIYISCVLFLFSNCLAIVFPPLLLLRVCFSCWFMCCSSSCPPRNSLWVSGLVSSVRAMDLQTLFSPYGQVSGCGLVMVCLRRCVLWFLASPRLG